MPGALLFKARYRRPPMLIVLARGEGHVIAGSAHEIPSVLGLQRGFAWVSRPSYYQVAKNCHWSDDDVWLITHDHISLPAILGSGQAAMDLVP